LGHTSCNHRLITDRVIVEGCFDRRSPPSCRRSPRVRGRPDIHRLDASARRNPRLGLQDMLTKYEGMPLHTLHNPVESHRALLRRKKMLALGLVLAIGIATALAFLLSS
jgi:hypothetical protein